MSNYLIVTDSSADLDAQLVKQLDVRVLPLRFTLENKAYQNHPDNRDMDPHLFYDKLRGGTVATTAAANTSHYTELLEPILAAGQDVLVLTFSSGLSSTYHISTLAVKELSEKFPERKIYTVDTLSASLGQGLLVWHCAKQKEAGKTIDEVYQWAEHNKLHLCHQFTVDDLQFLKRGGRVSATTAVVGTMLHIKPLLHVDNEGHLINIGKVRGRQGSLKALVDKMEATAIAPKNQMAFISHGDCLEDAQRVAQMVKERFGVEEIYINHIGPVIGAHSGPGTVALFYLGNER